MNAFQANRPLQPLGVIGIIRASLGVLFGNLVPIIGIPLITLAGMLAAVAAVMVPLVLGGRVIPAMLASPGEWPLGLALAILVGLLVLLAIPFLILWAIVGTGALIAAMGGAHLGQKLGIGAAFGVGMRRALPLLGATILSRLVIAFFSVPAVFLLLASGLLLVQGQASRDPQLQLLAIPFLCLTPFLLVVAIIVSLRLLFVPFAAVFEEAGPIGAMERSWAVTRGHVLRVFGYLIVLTLIAAGISSALQFLLGFAASQTTLPISIPAPVPSPTTPGLWVLPGAPTNLEMAGLAILGAGYSIVVALISLALQIAFIVLYFDIRHRDEGFGAAAGEPEPIPPPEGEPDEVAPEGDGEPAGEAEPAPSDMPDAEAAAGAQAEGDGAPVAEAAAVAVVAEEMSGDAEPTGDADAVEAAAVAAAVESVEAGEEPAAESPAVHEDTAAESPAWASLPIEPEGADAPHGEGQSDKGV